MYLKLKRKKIEIVEYTKIIERFKSFKFYLDKIDFGIKIPKKKYASTYLFCQRVDICFTDRDDKILYLYENVKTEKRFFKFKAYNVYYLPLNTSSELKIGDKLNVKDMISD